MKPKSVQVYSRDVETHWGLFQFLKERGIKPYPQNFTESQVPEVDKALLRIMNAVRKDRQLATEQRRKFINYLKDSRAELKKGLATLRGDHGN